MWKIACMAVALLMCLSGRAEAHFSMLIPSSSTVMEDKESSLELDVFSACAPWPGWWGFAALKTDRETMEYQGALKEVELGAVIWVEFTAPLKR